MPLQIPVTQTGLEASIEAAAKKAGRNLSINLGTNTRSISALSQPLGRITGQADEFTKSMEAANARVFAFGASVGIINGVTQAFGALVRNTIEVEKSLVEINTVLNASSDSLQEFGNKLFDVAKTTGQTFDTVAKGALELARQGLSTEETLKRINDALILSRLSGLDAQQSVEGLTAAFNSFQETGITTSQILNKLVVVSQKYSVSERDLIEGLKRSASVADQAGVSFDELVGIITTVQERTARGGAVIGNAFKTIFARIQDRGALEDLAGFGIKIQDLQGKILPATQILQNLAGEFNNLTQVEQADLAKKLGGVYQLSNLLAAVKDLSSEQSKYVDIVKLSAGATDEAYKKNAALNVTLATLINKVTLSAQQLGATLGEIGITNSLKELLNFINNIFEGFQKILGEESALGTLFKGIAQGIGNVLAGPGLAIFAAIIGKLSIQLAGFGIEALKSFFKITSTSKELQNIQGAITSTLLNNKQIQQQILSLEGNRVAQAQFISTALNEQLKTMQRMQSIAASITPDVYAATSGTRKGSSKNVTNSAGGYMPAVFQESRDISRGVGGARGGDKPVVIPNFAFGGGKKGTMVAHTGEYIVPNFAAGGSAIFNRDMVRSMGLPAGAQKIGAAGGFIPNFAEWYDSSTKKVVTSTDYPKTPGNWTKIASNSQTYRKYADTLENYKLPSVDFYLFPDGTGGRGATVRGALGRSKSKAVEKAEEEQEKISAAGEFKISANDLGGIAVVSPRFGSGARELSVTGRIGDYAIFNREDENSKIDKNRFITLSGIKGVNTPKPQDVKGLSVDINRLFADRVVDLAYKLYGGTFDSASAGEFGQKLKSLGDKQSLLPPTAEGQIFEAAGKVALNSIQNLESLFGSGEENRPFDFQNPKAIQQMFGINVLRGDAKRGGESGFVSKEGKMATSKNNKGQDMIRKSLNDPEYSAKMLNILKAQGAFSPEMQRKKKEEEISNAISGFVPNFASYPYKLSTLAPTEKEGQRSYSKWEKWNQLSGEEKKNTPYKSKVINNPYAIKQFNQGLRLNPNVEKDDKVDSLGFRVTKVPIYDEKLKEEIINKKNSKEASGRFEKLALEFLKYNDGSEFLYNRDKSSVDGFKFKGNKNIDLLEVKAGEWNASEVQNKFGRFVPENINLSGSSLIKGELNKLFTEGVPREQDVIKLNNTLAIPDIEGYSGKIKAGGKADPNKKQKDFYDAFSVSQLSQAQNAKLKKGSMGYIPNFVNQKYVMDTLARIKAGTSGFSKQEQETFLNKFGAKSTGRKISLREVYDKLDGDIGISALIDKAYMAAGPTASNEEVYKIFEKQIKANPYALRSLVSKKGFIPNFADPLKEAIGREMSAGVPASQIYVDQNSSLKNPMNPMGLMVANRRDEPSSGMQGINRARKEGANPMLYGAAGGFVPNYVNLSSAVSTSTGIGIQKGGGVDQALKEFSKNVMQAGADMDKLSAELKNKIQSLVNDKAVTQQLTEAAKQEIVNRKNLISTKQSSIAQSILENQSNKKIAAQLDKIYIEYNKSQKTRADLTAAEKKAAEVLQKTSLSQSSQRAIVSSTDSLAGSRSTAQPKAAGDLLAKMFGLQTALSLLTGATSDTKNAFATAANVITSVASSFTSVYLVFEGLKNAGGKLGSLFGAFGGKLGIYAAGIYAVYEGFKIFARYQDDNNIALQQAKIAVEDFSTAAAGAVLNLNNLSPERRKQVEKRSGQLIEGARRVGMDTAMEQGLLTRLSSSFRGGGEAVEGTWFTAIEGWTDDTEQELKKLVDQALGAGVKTAAVFNAIRKAAESDLGITADEVESLSYQFKELQKGVKKFSPEKFIKESGLSPESGIGKTLSEIGNNDQRLKTLLDEESQVQVGGKKVSDFLTNLSEKFGTDRSGALGLIKLIIEELNKQKTAEEEVGNAAIKSANLSLLKQQLENRIAYKNALFEASSAEEYSLELQKEMLSVSEKDRTLADYKLQSLQAAKKLTSDQADATINALKESELIQKKLEGMSPGGEIDPKQFEKLTSAAEKVSDIIREQGGYTEDAKNKTQELLAKTGLLPDQYGIILDIIKETNDQLSRQAALQNKMYALSNLQKATLEASNFVYEKRSESVTREYDRLSKSAEQRKRNLDLELEAFKVQKEREKIGGGAGGNLSIDRQIFEKEEYTINAKLKIDQEDLLNQLRKTLSEASLKAGFTPEQSAISSATTSKEDFEKIATIIEEAEKEAKIQKIEAALKETEVRTSLLNYEIDATKASADYWYESVLNTTKLLGATLGSIIPGLSDIVTGPPTIGLSGIVAGPPKPTALDRLQEGINNTRKIGIDDANKQIEAVRNLSKNFTGLFDTIGDTFVGVDQTGQEAANSIGNLKNALLSAGASLTTFANLVRGVFTSLPETIAQNKFAMLTATDTQSIIGNAVEARRNAILSQGPASAGTIAQAADATAIYEKELEIKRAITAEDKINGEFELQKLKEILPLRMQLLEAETNEEREAIIDRIIAKEKQRLPVLDRIKAAMVSTPEQRTQELEDSLVNASVQFRDNLIDGVSKAIEEGGSLGDVLRSAALDFARSMTQAGLKNVTSQIGGLFGFAKGGLVPSMASGGMINGGSGSKDDVPAMLMGGEYVLKKTAVQKYGSDFLDALNNGRLGGYAKGGKVNEIPNQTGAGGFFASGLYDTGSIVGKENLLSFATQSYTSGARDIISSGNGASYVNLEPESMRLTQFGRANDRMSQVTQSIKEQSFGLYVDQLNQEADYERQLEEYRKQKEAEKKAQKKALRNQLITMAITAAAGPILGAAGAGFKAAFGAAGGMQNFLPSVGAGFKGIFTGGSVGGVNVGGLGNLFKGVGQGLTGNFSGAGNSFKLSQIGTAEQLQGAFNKSVKSGSGFSGFLKESGYTPQGPAIGVNGGGGGGGIFDWFNKIKSGVGGLFGGGRDIDAQGFEATGEDIKDPSQWIRGGDATSYDEGVLPPLDWKKGSSDINFNSIPLEQDTGKRAVLNAGNGKRYAIGGQIPNTAGVDTVPAMLSGGEFIMNRAASQNIGAGNLQALNAGAGSLPTEEKTEELNDKLIAKLDELIEASGSAGSITINVEATSGKTSEQTSGDDNDRRVQMARLIKDMVLKVIQDEKRLGGTLRRG
jgi:TP901 family phage tail tape measure protein